MFERRIIKANFKKFKKIYEMPNTKPTEIKTINPNCTKNYYCYNCKNFRRITDKNILRLLCYPSNIEEISYCANEVECKGYDEGER